MKSRPKKITIIKTKKDNNYQNQFVTNQILWSLVTNVLQDHMDVSDDEEDYYADAPETINIDDEEDVVFAGEVAGRRQAPLSMYIIDLILSTYACVEDDVSDIFLSIFKPMVVHLFLTMNYKVQFSTF